MRATVTGRKAPSKTHELVDTVPGEAEGRGVTQTLVYSASQPAMGGHDGQQPWRVQLSHVIDVLADRSGGERRWRPLAAF